MFTAKVCWKRAVILLGPLVLSGCGGDNDGGGDVGGGGGNPPPAVGTIRVNVDFTGTDFDVASPAVLLDGGSPQTGIGAPIVFNQVAAGNHEVTLQGLHARCVRTGSAAQAATVTTGNTTEIRYSVDCRDTDQLAYRATSLMISDADGQRTHQVFNPNGSIGAPAWSNDGRRLVFNYNDEIWSINADGTDLRKLPWSDPNFKPHDFSWSPDGTRLAFALSYVQSPMVTPAKIAVMDPAGTIIGESVVTDGLVSQPSWAPDSSRFAYAAVGDGTSGVHVLTRDAAEFSFNYDNVSGGDAAWSPDGQTIVFARGHELREITPANNLVQDLTVCPRRCIDVVWAPDGNTLIVHNTDDLRLIDTTGALLSVIPGQKNTPVWSPSGIYVAWTSDTGLTSAHPDGSNAVAVSDAEQVFGPAWRP